MGKAFSALASTAIAPLRNYNIENRAQRIISQNKPNPAPRFESDQKELDRIIREHPEVVEETSRKDDDLDDRLKQVFVTSSHEIDQKRFVNPNRPLPTSTEHVKFFELGFKETDAGLIPPGKLSLRQAVKFIEDHRMQPEEWTKEKIASEYKLKLDDVQNILQYFRLFAVRIPEKGKEKKRLLSVMGKDTQNFNEYLEKLKEATGQTGVTLASKIRELREENIKEQKTSKISEKPTEKSSKE